MSWKKRRDLVKAQTDHNLPSHTLIADCPTRWGFIHKMVARILEQVTAIRISKLAMKYLSICATSSSSERVFSASGKIVTPLQNSLKPDKVDKLVFLSQNRDLLLYG